MESVKTIKSEKETDTFTAIRLSSKRLTQFVFCQIHRSHLPFCLLPFASKQLQVHGRSIVASLRWLWQGLNDSRIGDEKSSER